VLTAGFTVTCAPVRGPGIHVYVTAPLAVNVVEAPLQLVADVMLRFGSGATVTIVV
jgi:hypothetical protein